MLKVSRKTLSLSSILVFAFIYRAFLMFREGYPPGADIGLHNSIIHSITQSGNTNFLWNNYHMGGGVSLTFPGYHIFVSYINMMTGMPEFVVHGLVACLFSTLIVAVAFLITQRIWSISAAWIVAILVTFSRFDIEMLGWGGYPNVITLMLIPLTFFIFLQKNRFSFPCFITVASLLSASIFLTHSLSTIIFAAIIFSAAVIRGIFSNRLEVRRSQFLVWLLPLVLGVVIISPFIAEIAPLVLGASSDPFAGATSNVSEALLTLQPLTASYVLPFALSVCLIFLFSRKYQGRLFSVPALLVALWILVPLVGTQGYLAGVYTDYTRFSYFMYLPVIIVLGLVIEYASQFIVRIPDFVIIQLKSHPPTVVRIGRVLSKLRPFFSRKIIYVCLIIVFSVYSVASFSFFAAPAEGIGIQTFYQVMNNPRYEAIQWAQNNTSADAVFVTDAYYGWWFSGFAQRKTFSGSDPQFLILSREFAPAENAKNLLDTDFMIDNGLIQVREDGGYSARHNPLFLTRIDNAYKTYDLFHFNSSDNTITCSQAGRRQTFRLSELTVENMHMENSSDHATITVTSGNHLFNLTETLTVYQGTRFAKMTYTLTSDLTDIHFDNASFLIHTKWAKLVQKENTMALLDDQVTNVMGQFIFTENQPASHTTEDPEELTSLELQYGFGGNSQAQIQFFVGVFQIPDEVLGVQNGDQIQSFISNNTQTYTKPISSAPLDVFNYRNFLENWKIDYVVCRDALVLDKFVKDPLFSLVYANSDVSIFKVNLNSR
ncbi:MAG: hypothetical protein NWF05_06170 [Candidatus Bathyarchaeota archaeon]|nr:hypothetical protein [Candidatus Bathyarchaeota archaeon]